jgi:predicted acyl esterase
MPGKIETVPVTLIATAVRIHPGHRIRMSVAGHDASMFRRYPAEGAVVLQVQRNTVYASSIDLPVLAQP